MRVGSFLRLHMRSTLAWRKLGCSPFSRRRSPKSGDFGGFAKTAPDSLAEDLQSCDIPHLVPKGFFLDMRPLKRCSVQIWACHEQKRDFYHLFSERSDALKKASKFSFEGV